MGFREYARHRGCALKSVQKAIASGRITAVDAPDGAKKIDPMHSDAHCEKYTQHNKCPKKCRQDRDEVQPEDERHLRFLLLATMFSLLFPFS